VYKIKYGRTEAEKERLWQKAIVALDYTLRDSGNHRLRTDLPHFLLSPYEHFPRKRILLKTA
jgi:hypothetical protein